MYKLVDRLKEDMVLFVCTTKNSHGNVMILGFKMHGKICPSRICHILNVTHAWGLMFLVGDGNIKLIMESQVYMWKN
jgi:hypothetical protein